LACHNHMSSRKVFPFGAELVTTACCAGDVYSGWTREIMPYAEDDALRKIYDPSLVITNLTDPNVKQFRETFVPLYHCPSDFDSELLNPDSGPAAGNLRLLFRTSSYVANAGRGDGWVTWYLYEDITYADGRPLAAGRATKFWRGPVHAECTDNPPADRHELRREKIANITDGTSKTLLLGEKTNLYDRRRSFWAYTWGNYLMFQPTAQPRTFHPEYPRCRTESTPEDSAPNMPKSGGSGRTCMSTAYSNHPGGFNAVRCDSSADWISYDIDLSVYAAMGSMAAGESDATGF
jgi:hypothetical protein